MHEFELIAAVRAAVRPHPRVPLGIGDDAAVITTASGDQLALAVDTLMEGVHFRLSEDDNAGFPFATPELAGRKALAVNLSDLAAMATRPLAAVVGVVFPRDRGAEFARRVMQGVQTLADEFGIALVGGDTNVWQGPLIISVTVVGEATDRGYVRRDGAQVGDRVVVTGPLGGSGNRRHLEFTPRVREALAIHNRVRLHAMIDLSDGLSSDLRHILDASGVGVVLDADRIPIAAEVSQVPSALEHALGDGEDFELLFTLSAEDAKTLVTAAANGELACESALIDIGEIVPAGTRELVWPDGTRSALPRIGWEHQF